MKRTKHIWKRFFSLNVGDDFFISRNNIARKVGFCSYRKLATNAGDEPDRRISIFRRVRTTQPIKTQRITATECRESMVNQPSFPGLALPRKQHLDAILAKVNAHDMGDHRDINPGKTHYVGDSCPGGHAEVITHPDNPVFATTGCAIDYDSNVGKLPYVERDPMAQDHTPDPQPQNDRTL